MVGLAQPLASELKKALLGAASEKFLFKRSKIVALSLITNDFFFFDTYAWANNPEVVPMVGPTTHELNKAMGAWLCVGTDIIACDEL